jgi:hypothetical protein
MKMIKICFSIIMLFTISSCSGVKSIDINNYIGLYQVMDTDCNARESSFDSRGNTLFFEILKGQFVGIQNSEIGYFFWSGNPGIDSELQYTSHILSSKNTQKISSNIFWLSENKEAKEYLTFSNEKLEKVHLEYTTGTTSGDKVIEYTLKAVRRGSLPFVRMNYPGK